METDLINTQISRLNELSLRCFWRIISKEMDESKVLLERPNTIDAELFRLSINALGSEPLANLAVKELLPLFETNQIKEAHQVILENFEKFKKEKKL